MDFHAFVESYFALVFVFFVVWMILSQWDTFMMFACLTFGRMDIAVPISSGPLSDPMHAERANGMSVRNIDAGEGDDLINGSVSAFRKSVWSHFSARLILRRRQQETPSTIVEPAGLEAVVCV